MARGPTTRTAAPRAPRPAGEPSAADDLLELFSVIGAVEVRRLFGGRGVFRDGLMFALQSRGDVYLKVDPAFAERLAGLGSTPFHYVSTTREVTLPYWRLPDEALDDDDLRRDLFRQAMAVAHAAAARKAPKRTGRPPRSAAKSAPAESETGTGSAPPDFDALGLGGPAPAPVAAPARAGRTRSAPKAAKRPPRRPQRT